MFLLFLFSSIYLLNAGIEAKQQSIPQSTRNCYKNISQPKQGP